MLVSRLTSPRLFPSLGLLCTLASCGLVDTDGSKNQPAPAATPVVIPWTPLKLGGDSVKYGLTNFDCGKPSAALSLDDTTQKFLSKDSTRAYGNVRINLDFMLLSMQISDSGTACDYQVEFKRNYAAPPATPPTPGPAPKPASTDSSVVVAAALASGSAAPPAQPLTVTYIESQALVTGITLGTQGCATTKASLDAAFKAAALTLDMTTEVVNQANIDNANANKQNPNRKLTLAPDWIGLRLPPTLQASSACAGVTHGQLRAYYATRK